MKKLWITLIKLFLFIFVIGFLILIISPFIKKSGSNQNETTQSIAKTYKLSKRDVTSEPETVGSSIKIKDNYGNVVKEWTATEETTYFELAEGSYIFEETLENKTTVETTNFTISNDGSVTSEEKKSEEIEESTDTTQEEMQESADVPITDKDASQFIYLIGFALLACGILKTKTI